MPAAGTVAGTWRISCPVAVPAGYAALTVTGLKLAPHGPGHGLGPAWFGVLVALGLAAGGLYRWAPLYAGYHQAWPLGLYLSPALVAIATATRGIRSARSAALP